MRMFIIWKYVWKFIIISTIVDIDFEVFGFLISNL